jgi:hypothetical protein
MMSGLLLGTVLSVYYYYYYYYYYYKIITFNYVYIETTFHLT